MDQNQTPVLDAIEQTRSAGTYSFSSPFPTVPWLEELDLEQAMSPRDAYFAVTEQDPDPLGRISAEMVSPYPPGVPAILPGERFTEAVVTYLRTALEAGAMMPDAADPELKTFRVVRDS